MNSALIIEGLTFYLLLVVAISMHEFGHAYTAYKLGDMLPKLQGRVTLNPIAHMDLMGTVVFPLIAIFISISGGGMILFGWGKPVMVSLPNPKTRMRDDLLSTAAGPAMNLVVALISAILAGVLYVSAGQNAAGIAMTSVAINCMLFVFNMLPLPPLDGSHFMRYAVGMSEEVYRKISSYSFIILLVLINITQFRVMLGFVMRFVGGGFEWIAERVVELLI